MSKVDTRHLSCILALCVRQIYNHRPPPPLYPWLGNVIFLHHHMHVIWCHPPQMVKMWFSFINSSPSCGVLILGPRTLLGAWTFLAR